MDIGALHVRRLPTWGSYLVPNREGTLELKNAGLHLSDGLMNGAPKQPSYHTREDIRFLMESTIS